METAGEITRRLRPPSNDPADLCLLCSACHKRLVHGGHVRLEGRAPALTVVRPERVA